VASYFSNLKKANAELGSDATLIKYFVLVSKNPDVSTADELRTLISTSNRFAEAPLPTKDLAALLKVIKRAKSYESAGGEVATEQQADTPATEVTANEVTAEKLPERPVSPADEALDSSKYKTVELIPKGLVANATVSRQADGFVQISWAEAKGKAKVYRVAASSDKFPNNVMTAEESWVTKDSKLSVETSQAFFRVYVFDSEEATGTLVAEGRLMGEVGLFELESYSERVLMRWESSDPSSKVTIYKSDPNKPLPARLTDAKALRVPEGAVRFEDRDVVSGQTFEYRAQLEWVSASGLKISSKGLTREVAIPGDIPSLEGFRVTRRSAQEDLVDIEYLSLNGSPAAVKVYQVDGPPSETLQSMRAVGSDTFPIKNLEQPEFQQALGSEIKVEAEIDGELTRINSVPMLAGEGSRTYVAVVFLGGSFRVGAVQVVQRVAAIQNLELVDFFDYQLLRLDLPAGATMLQVWEKNADATWDSVDKEVADRLVDIEDEYRRYGGVVFAEPVPGQLSDRHRLRDKPKKIFVRGISVFDGIKHAGEHAEYDFPGRVEVRYKRVSKPQQEKEKPTGFFGFGRGKTQAKPDTAIPQGAGLQFQISGAADSEDIRLHLVQAKTQDFPLTKDGNLSVDQLKLQAGKYRTFTDLLVSETGSQTSFASSEKPQQPQTLKVVSPQIGRVRVTPFFREVSGTPVFVVDELMSNVRPDAPGNPSKGLSIALVGAKRSGKTTYAQALLHYVERQFTENFASRVFPGEGDELAKHKLETVHNFVKDGALPPGTKSARLFSSSAEAVELDDPRRGAKFEFEGAHTPLGSIELFDLAGEDMDSVEDLQLYAEQLRAADLIIFLLDPMQIQTVETVAAGRLAMPGRSTDPFVVLRNLEKVLGPVEDRSNKNQKLAITISKFDALVRAFESEASPFKDALSKGMAVTRDPNAFTRHAYNSYDGREVDAEVRAILKALGQDAFSAIAQDGSRFSQENVKFFVVSALGHDTRNRANGISSFRIGDPIRWALQDQIK
jgi:hypothetical protein